MCRYIRLLAVAALCSGILAGCGTGSGAPPTPTAASPIPQPNTTQRTFTVSGVVSELVGGQTVPLAGAHVEDSERHVSVKTGRDGSYTLADVANSPSLGNAYIYFAKEGYRSQSRQFLLTSDSRVDVTLVRE
jgi:hypothetical protein